MKTKVKGSVSNPTVIMAEGDCPFCQELNTIYLSEEMYFEDEYNEVCVHFIDYNEKTEEFTFERE